MLKHFLKAALVAVLLVGANVPGPMVPEARAQTAEISFSVFYQELAPYGRWFEHPRWGWVWFPTAVDADWRPYTRGRWVWTAEHGWYWEAEEAFGWAVYHYGRWAYDEQYGWTWVPGTVWGPAWVAFREGDGYAGWAPLPPETLYDTAPSYESPYTEMSADYYLPRWVFVSLNYFLAPSVGPHAARWNDNRGYFGRTRNVTRYSLSDRRIQNRSLAPERIRSVTGRPVAATRINDARQPGATRTGRRDRGANVVNVYRPQVRATTDAPPPPATRVRPNDRPRAAIRREALPPSERRRIERGTPGVTPPSTVTKPETPTQRTPGDAPRTTPPSTVTKPQPPTHAAPPPPRTAPPSTITKPQPPTHAAPPPPTRTTPPSTVARPPQPPTHAAPPPPTRTAPPSTVARPPQPPVRAAPPPPRTAPPTTIARPPHPPARPAPPAAAKPTPPPPPAAKPSTPPPAKPAAKPSCGGPGQPPCPR